MIIKGLRNEKNNKLWYYSEKWKENNDNEEMVEEIAMINAK